VRCLHRRRITPFSRGAWAPLGLRPRHEAAIAARARSARWASPRAPAVVGETLFSVVEEAEGGGVAY